MKLHRLLATSALLLGLVGCGSTDPVASDPTGSGSGSGSPGETEEVLSGTVTVFAAASLTDVFTALGEQFQSEHPEVSVEFNFAGSSTLAEQINQGAAVDVFASASPPQMQAVVDAGLAAGQPEVFVSNTLQIVVSAGNPAEVTGLEDFTKPDLIIALCAEEVPCGAASVTVFEVAGLTPMPDTLEQDVRAVLTKVELGEVDAALVYRTDVLAGGDEVEGIDFPESADAVNDYPIVTLADAPNPDAAAAFVEFLRSDVGLGALQDAGFQVP